MKNNGFIIYLTGLLALSSCGTYYQAVNNSEGFQNGIYYNAAASHSAEEGRNLIVNESRTLQEKTYSQLESEPAAEVNLTIAADPNSYAAKLRRFDSPKYTVNVVIDYGNWIDPWWSPWWYRNPYYYGYGWYTSWDYWYWRDRYWRDWYWRDPWYYGYGLVTCAF